MSSVMRGGNVDQHLVGRVFGRPDHVEEHDVVTAAGALRQHRLVVQALIGHEFEIDLDVRIGLGEGLGHGADVGLAIGGLRHEQRIERRFGIGVRCERLLR